MIKRYSKVALGVMVAMSGSAFTATAIHLKKTDVNMLQAQFLNKKAINSQQSSKLKAMSSHIDFNHVNHVRMQQMYESVPVEGGYAIFHTKNAKGLALDASTTVNGTVYRDLSSELGAKPTHFLSRANNALVSLKKNYQGKNLSQEKSTPMIYIDDTNVAHWAYQVSVLAGDGKSRPTRPTAIVDAKTFKPFVQWDDIKTLRENVKAEGYGGNPRAGKYLFGEDFVALDVTRDVELATCYMENDDVKIVDMKHSYYSDNQPMSFACTDDELVGEKMYWTGANADGYDEYNQGYSPSNDALYGGYVIKHMYRDWYDLQVLNNPDGTPMQLVMRVHYGNRYQNAYWDGKRMTFGDGGSLMYPLVSLGVGAHEISHGFTQQNSDLRYYGQSGGMNESFSDMAAQAAEFYSVGESSWEIGEHIMKESSGYEALRYMDRPSRDHRSIDSAKDYYSGLDVHYSSGVYNRLFYLMATSEDWSARKAFDVMVKANQDYWTPRATFKSAACGVLNATADYDYDIASVKAALDKVDIDYTDCE